MTDSDVNRIIVELKSLQISHNELAIKINAVHQETFGVKGTSSKGLVGRMDVVENKLNKVIIILSVAAGSGGLGALITKLVG